ncbi:hypothetical protein PRIPAC_86420 [Pristionchus pacificus]|uniref:CUB domain-containing protein n=1 Tax=Pristionchus pacificus TaxID=54126 RepID=A0A2A6CE51_PRIPA|nr:hypothetical protein PRIPAC_86420 [Pristionchus pacificus]|eukprot:PDM76482.1 CUB domain-containing protein [Pristionchus pacificus]
MLLRLLIAAAVATLASTESCPAGFDLMGGGRCIQALDFEIPGKLSTLLLDRVAKCEALNGHLPIVKSAQDNTDYINIVAGFDELKGKNVMLVLGLICNTTTARLNWEDHSAITYIQPPAPGQLNVDLTYDCVKRTDRVVSRITPKDWFVVPDTTSYPYTFLCETDPIEANLDAHCGEYEEMTVSTDFNNPCIKIYADKLVCLQAQERCHKEDFGSLATIHNDQENLYIWRTAIASNVTAGGVHIGAYLPDGETTSWKWIDGDVPITGSVYNHFESFPPPGVTTGMACSVMIVDASGKAFWETEDCDTQLAPSVCRRSRFPPPTFLCPTTPPPAGIPFFPPGFPNSNITCEYNLRVEAGMLVELEVMNLEANKGADFLVVYEGVDGNPLKNLTGSTPVPPDNIITTVSKNTMRVSWEPHGAVNVRGFRLQYRPVPP